MSAEYFYATFGVRPEDLSLGYQRLLEQAAGALVITTLVVVMFVVGAVGGALVLRRMWRDVVADYPTVAPRRIGIALGLVAVVASVGLLVAGAQDPGNLLRAAAMIALGVGLTSAPWPRRWVAVAAFCAVLELAMFAVVMFASAGDERDRALEGKRVWTMGAPWRAMPAKVVAKHDGLLALRGIQRDCALLLGFTERGPVLYVTTSRGRRRTLTLSDDEVSVAVRPHDDRCRWPSYRK